VSLVLIRLLCAGAEIEGLARIGVACLQLLLVEAGNRFDVSIWTQVCDLIGRLFSESTPHELIAAKQFLPQRPSALAAAVRGIV
jgi:hypothetical protein